jgi:hypothetical protein
MSFNHNHYELPVNIEGGPGRFGCLLPTVYKVGAKISNFADLHLRNNTGVYHVMKFILLPDMD